MDSLLFYTVLGVSIVFIALIWFRFYKDNSKQEKLIAKYTKDIKRIQNNRNHY